MFKKILIANRGEIALRIIRTCKKLNIKTVAIYSQIDKNSIHTYLADEAICIGNHETKNTYLNIKNIINAAIITQADAIHPGYGFLSENEKFVKEINKNKLTFIGPNIKLIKQFGNKVHALNIAKKYKLNVLPTNICSFNQNKNIELAQKIGYPIIIKAVLGGGGKGIRIVKTQDELQNNILLARKEAYISYQNTSIYMEKYIKNSRHIEFQIIGDGKKIIILGERECSIQEKYQKIIEETPVKNIDEYELNKIKKQCKIFCEQINYDNIGTIEFLYENKQFYFIEVNPRLQVEHTISENITNIDIVEKQIEVAFKKQLNMKQSDIKYNGHSIQCRINITKYQENKIKFLHVPGGNGIRFDSHIYNGYKIPINYDKLLGKLTAHGKTRHESIKIMLSALNEIIIYNINTNIPLLIKILSNIKFKKNKINTNFLKNIHIE